VEIGFSERVCIIILMKNLIVTTKADLDTGNFTKCGEIFLLENFAAEFSRIKHEQFDTIYFRSHFSIPETLPNVFATEIDTVSRDFARNYFIDNTKTCAEIIDFEDKWQQYQIFRELMPETWRFRDAPKDEKLIYKKRISSRARGVAFSRDEVLDGENWIAQRKMEILCEMRIYIICGEIFPLASTKSNKTETQKVKILEIIRIANEEIEFAKKVAKMTPKKDFLGIDVAKTQSGLFLIEANRSPSFASFYKLSGINLAENLYKGVAKELFT